MTWPLLVILVLALILAVIGLARRRAELHTLRQSLSEIAEAQRRGSHRARLQHPVIDLARCIGCGGCVRACPEEGVLDLVHGQAVVVHGARCVGHSRCVAACPTGAVAVTLSDLSEREDIPAITDRFEAKGTEGLFLAGELTGYALVRTAIAHGKSVAEEVAERPRGDGNGTLDLLVVGAGPAGISCSLRARELGLRFRTIDQESLGGTVARYPRKKLVMTQPVDLPLHGRLGRTSYEKEELVGIWEKVVEEHDLPVKTGVRFEGLAREPDGAFRVKTSEGEVRARNVCLALGRRGTPRKLGVPGEDLPKVAYSLIDAQGWRDARLLVVGGGDSAVEAAIALAEQPGNEVTLSYRKEAFFRIKAKNERRLAQSEKTGRLKIHYRSEVAAIEPEAVRLRLADGETRTLPNDQVFVMAGGIPPFPLLEASGVSFRPEDRDEPAKLVEQGTGLFVAVIVTLILAVAALGFALLHSGYYLVPIADRLGYPLFGALRPAGATGLTFALLGCLLMVFNISYLWRRSRFGSFLPGSLSAWMGSHLLTGILAFLLILLHSGLSLRSTTGGHAFLALTVVIAAGAIGRYFYSFVPRAANGREVMLSEAKAKLAAISGEWDRAGGDFGQRVHREVNELISAAPWQESFFRRLGHLVTGQRKLRRTLARLHREGVREGIPGDEIGSLLGLARRAHRTALMVAHFEDLRALLGTWRYFHRWLALLMFLLAAIHIATSVKYANLAWEDLWFLRVFGAGR